MHFKKHTRKHEHKIIMNNIAIIVYLPGVTHSTHLFPTAALPSQLHCRATSTKILGYEKILTS